MPKWGHVLQIYCRDEKEKEEWKKISKELGVSISALVRAFFRALAEGSKNITVNYTDNRIQIGEINIDLKQQNIVQINNNIIAFINLKLRDILEEVNKALKKPSILSYNQALVYTKNQIQKILEEIKTLGG